MEKIKITISKADYSIKIDLEGYSGGRCVTDIDEIQSLMNAITLSEDIKPEYVSIGETTRVTVTN